MPSHLEYIADKSEEQLRHLIEVAQQRLDNLVHGGWVSLWVVHDDGANRGWFAESDYAGALAFLGQLGARHAAQGSAGELGVQTYRVRPVEAESLLELTRDRAAVMTQAAAHG